MPECSLIHLILYTFLVGYANKIAYPSDNKAGPFFPCPHRAIKKESPSVFLGDSKAERLKNKISL